MQRNNVRTSAKRKSWSGSFVLQTVVTTKDTNHTKTDGPEKNGRKIEGRKMTDQLTGGNKFGTKEGQPRMAPITRIQRIFIREIRGIRG
jgi:hypothetical protein